MNKNYKLASKRNNTIKEENELVGKYGLASSYYDNNLSEREELEQTWKDCSQLTLPYVYTGENSQKNSILPTPFNSIGPAAVNALVAKLLASLLPSTGMFFRLLPHRDKLIDLSEEEIKQVENELSQVEQDVVEEIATQNIRVPLTEALKLLVITGNALIYKVPNKGLKTFSPYQYIVKRDIIGHMLSMCIEEEISILALPENIRNLIINNKEKVNIALSSEIKDSKVKIYTMILREQLNKYIVYQEIDGMVIPNSMKHYTEEELPYFPLRWSSVQNESYGRGIVEQYLGDFRTLEGLTQIITETTSVMAKVVFGKKPASQVKIKDLTDAKNGDIISGDLERDITVLQVNKGADLSIAAQQVTVLEQRLQRAFLMFSPRNSERTTATEIRAMSAELEAILGGTYSVIDYELMRPLVSLILKEIHPKVMAITDTSITSGMSSINREKDFNNISIAIQTIAQLGEVAVQKINIDGVISSLATSLGIAPETFVKSQAQIAQEQEQQLRMQQQQQLQDTAQQVVIDNNRQNNNK